jgi:hypothetical protein
MARMIPASIYRGCASPGEREIFQRLRDDPCTQDWIVLHSLDIAEHQRQVSGESDFVIVVPSKGVLCVEVKASSTITRTAEGLWYYGKDLKGDARGPFKQASWAMHAVRDSLLSARPDLSKVIFWSAVVFPYVPFTTTSGEWHSWQVIDRHVFTSRPLSASIEMILDRGCSHLQAHSAFKFVEGVPSLEQCESIARVLRPRFEFVESSKSHAERLRSELKHYTEEQFLALDAMAANRRVAFEGPAGTGKTMLAIEAARRAGAEGRRVLLVCFNRFLGRWLEEETVGLRPNVRSLTLHRYMLDVAQVDPSFKGRDPRFWDVTLPELAVEKQVEAKGDDDCFDEMVIDEAQDILRDGYLDFLDLSLKGGLASGRWRMFGDFEKQAIYGSANLSLEKVLDSRAHGAPVYSLRVNCRNPPRIAETARLLGGLNPSYTRILRPDNGVEPRILYYKDEAGQEEQLRDTLDRLNKDGFRNGDIVVLSTKADLACASAQIKTQPWKGRLRAFNSLERSHIRYCSIHAFKGMEAPAVIVTDVDRISDPASRALFYVAITRAVERLVLLVHEPMRGEIIHTLI